MKKRIQGISIIFPLTFILAFCSIVYELLLAQSLSAFLENTVLRYSITIGFYMFAMGCGALLMESRYMKRPVILLLQVEILLTLLGGSTVVLLHMLNLSGISRLSFLLTSHLIIIAIGVLTGAEIPLLIEMRNKEKDNSENIILGVDYIGALAGTVIFAFVFYPKTGLVPTAFFIGLLNALAGILLYTQREKIALEDKKEYYTSLGVQSILCVIVTICMTQSQQIHEYFIDHYLRY